MSGLSTLLECNMAIKNYPVQPDWTIYIFPFVFVTQISSLP
ncbi:hypothetical protein XIS1_30008 [Xenorhabdus innexi]|uniref:Uncharacterized protein n=1 Tax=Xenorhabdus innexi TaxID=290109 RepID=A0A1N6MXL1_9GAMM|nr:hypothetical protein XIS1_30008 [Xenorhabdus innexi]